MAEVNSKRTVQHDENKAFEAYQNGAESGQIDTKRVLRKLVHPANYASSSQQSGAGLITG